MNKSKLVNGAIVELRNGNQYIKIDNTLINLDMSGNFMNMDNYDSDLLDCDKSFDWDIIKVNNDVFSKQGYCAKALANARKGIWTWVRKDKYYEGKLVCIDNRGKKGIFTVGKIYTFKDGQTTTDDGGTFPTYRKLKSFEDLDPHHKMRFVEMVE